MERQMGIPAGAVLMVATVLLAALPAQADVAIQTVRVGNAGNPDDTHGDGYGGVVYAFDIAKYEVTAGQYCTFLNAVAAADPNNLYQPYMASSTEKGCMIRQNGSEGNYAYLVDADDDGQEDADWVDRPVNFVPWYSAARFCNWLHNGQREGAQDATTTEDGSYDLTGLLLNTPSREPDATWVLPTEDEWYKAAYHVSGGTYFDYPTRSNEKPSNILLDPDQGNNANYFDPVFDHTLGAPYWRSEVGDFEHSESPYFTFDQAGNVDEWTEDIWEGLGKNIVRGGGYASSWTDLAAEHGHHCYPPSFCESDVGFRPVLVPEPTTVGLLTVGLGLALRRRRRRAA